MDEQLFNGEYYEHHIAVPDAIRPDLTSSMGAKDLDDPILQLGAGCLVDQLVGQYMAHILGLGYLHDPENVRKTLASVMRCNFLEDFHHHFNQMRSYVLGDESALLMASYPRGNRPAEPFPYYNEVMTGFEHTAAAHMLYEGMNAPALKVIDAIRSRYDGYKRNPFDEAECGHHYARAMASWAEVLAISGFHYSAVDKVLTFAAREGRYFWSSGFAWGTCSLSKSGVEWNADLTVLFGTIAIDKFVIAGAGACATGKTVFSRGDVFTCRPANPQ